MQVKWLPRALIDLMHLREYIAQDSPGAAKSVADRILGTVSYLREHPEIGRAGRRPGTREMIVPGLPYIIPYRFRQGSIEILRVLHTSRRWPEHLSSN